MEDKRGTAQINTSGHVYHYDDLVRIHAQYRLTGRATRQEFTSGMRLDLQRGLYEVTADMGEKPRDLALNDGRLRPDPLRSLTPRAFVPSGPPGTDGTSIGPDGPVRTPPGTPPQRG